ncbi:MAG TPA: ATP synthase F1 subunit delta [Pyrinomonadaceae bacterium]|nr:ATP synthase F1 subunit delta [Pyrinomonadaceae bacterium]
MSMETVARRYASALADVVLKTGETQTVLTELKTWESMFGDGSNLFQVFGNPSIAHLSKEKVLENLIERAKPNRTTANFLRVLLRNNRLTELSEINERFISVLDERSGLISAEVTSARPLGEAEKAEIRASLEKLTRKKVNLNYKIDEKIIGGVVTRVGSTVYDGSVKTQLENLREELVNG